MTSSNAILRHDFHRSAFIRGTVYGCISAKILPSVWMWSTYRYWRQCILVLKTPFCGKFMMLGPCSPAVSDAWPALSVCCVYMTCTELLQDLFCCSYPNWALLLQDHNNSRDAESPSPLQTLYFPGLFCSDLEFNGNCCLCQSNLLLMLLKLHQHSYSDQLYNRGNVYIPIRRKLNIV